MVAIYEVAGVDAIRRHGRATVPGEIRGGKTQHSSHGIAMNYLAAETIGGAQQARRSGNIPGLEKRGDSRPTNGNLFGPRTALSCHLPSVRRATL